MSRAKQQKADAEKNGGDRWDANQQGTARVGPGSKHAKTGDQAESNGSSASTLPSGNIGGNTSTSNKNVDSGGQGQSTGAGTGMGTGGGSAGSGGSGH